MLFQLYLTGAVYSLDGSDSLKETMQTSIAAADKVTAGFTGSPRDRMDHVLKCVFSFYWLTYHTHLFWWCLPPEPGGGGRASPARGRHRQQAAGWSPGQGRAAGGGPGQPAAEQRSQGDPDGGPAAQRRQIIPLRPADQESQQPCVH